MPFSRELIAEEISKTWTKPRCPALVRVHDSEACRYRHARTTSMLSALFYASILLIEPFLVQDMFWVSVVCRLVIVPICLGVLLMLMATHRPMIEIHLGMGFTVALAAALWSYIFLSGSHQGPPYYFLAGFIFFVVPNIFMRLKFKAAAISNSFILAIMGFDASQLPDRSTSLLLIDLMMISTTLVLTLTTNWTLDREAYTIFLQKLISELDQKRLSQRNNELLALSATDALTGIGNRRAADAMIQALWQGKIERDESFALFILDVDYFKLFNDNYSHMAGDDCLKAIAAVVQAVAQHAGCSAFRFGGEEFLLASKCEDALDAALLAEAIMGSVRGLPIPHQFRPDALQTVSVSIGIAFSEDLEEKSVSELLRVTDSSLYRAKKQGRNQWHLFAHHGSE